MALQIMEQASESHSFHWMGRLEDLTYHQSRSVRIAVIELLPAVDVDRALLCLLRIAVARWGRGCDMGTREAARRALDRRLRQMFGAKDLLAGERSVLRLAAHPNPDVRMELAAHFAGTLRADLEAARTVLTLLADDDEDVRESVFGLIAKERIVLLVRSILRAEQEAGDVGVDKVVSGALQFLAIHTRGRAGAAELPDAKKVRLQQPKPAQRCADDAHGSPTS